MMKTQLLAAAVVLVTSVQAFGQSCGCDSHHVVARPVASCGCDRCCTPCHRPLLELVEGIGCTLHSTASTLKNGVHRLFHPITFNGCGCYKPAPSCGCDTCGSDTHWESHEMMSSPKMEYIEPSHPSVPSIPGPPTTPSTEPSHFETPGKWQPVGTQAKRSSAHVSHYTKRVTPASTARPATYYAPTRSK
ncbi:hypothetical protein [Bremerella cremea]|uniref:hypothetical protein n=1 Tax=Bremerella cremea TaxID=1031537 RepID=UPI0031EBF2E1